MAKLDLDMCKGLVYQDFLREGWFPPGTTLQNWDALTMSDLLFDDPPLPGDPDFQKRRVSLDLRSLFYALGRQLADPFNELRTKDETLAEFSQWCYDNHQ
jgi:hypothetical protein